MAIEYEAREYIEYLGTAGPWVFTRDMGALQATHALGVHLGSYMLTDEDWFALAEAVLALKQDQEMAYCRHCFGVCQPEGKLDATGIVNVCGRCNEEIGA